MKKILLLLLGCTFAAPAFSQRYEFYTGIQAGPKLSFSDINNGVVSESHAKRDWHGGVVAGVVFPNKRLGLETGLLLARHSAGIQFMQAAEELPELTMAFRMVQVPLRLKTNLTNPDAKVSIKAITGLAYLNQSWSMEVASSFKGKTFDAAGYYTFAFPNEEGKVLGLKANLPGGNYYNSDKLLVELGFECQFDIYDQLKGLAVVTYQNSLLPTDRIGFAYSTDGESYKPVTVSANPHSVNIGLGLAYYFGKSN